MAGRAVQPTEPTILFRKGAVSCSQESLYFDIAGMPPGVHKVRIDLADADHKVFPGQSKTVTFTVPGKKGEQK